MASVDWQKYHSAIEVKAHIRHDEQVKRKNTKQHNNAEIDHTRTHMNFACFGRSYNDRCDMYDAAVSAANEKMSYVQEYTVKNGKHAGETRQRKINGLKKDAVTCLGLEVPAPAGLSESDARTWFMRVHEIMCDTFGVDNVIDTDVHFDEIHGYIDSLTHERVQSRIHSHTHVLPVTDDGRMCAKEICCRANMIALNNVIEEMSQREFGVPFLTGGYAQRKSVEQLKGESLKAENELLSERISALANVAEHAPKRKLFAIGEQYVMSKQEHDEYMQMCEEVRIMSQNALATDADKKSAAKAKRDALQLKRDAKQMKEQQEQLIQERAEQIAMQAVRKAKEREDEAEQAKEKYEALCKKIIIDPLQEFCDKLMNKKHRKVTDEKIRESIMELQLQTGVSDVKYMQSIRDELEQVEGHEWGV